MWNGFITICIRQKICHLPFFQTFPHFTSHHLISIIPTMQKACHIYLPVWKGKNNTRWILLVRETLTKDTPNFVLTIKLYIGYYNCMEYEKDIRHAVCDNTNSSQCVEGMARSCDRSKNKTEITVMWSYTQWLGSHTSSVDSVNVYLHWDIFFYFWQDPFLITVAWQVIYLFWNGKERLFNSSLHNPPEDPGPSYLVYTLGIFQPRIVHLLDIVRTCSIQKRLCGHRCRVAPELLKRPGCGHWPLLW